MTVNTKQLHTPACLIIMDGYGLAPAGAGNVIAQASTPVLDALFEERPWVSLEASGEAVGLPEGQMGNSEVGHLNIGAGRVVRQELTRINHACVDGSLASNEVIKQAFDQAKAPGAVLHLMGLLSDGGVHSSNEHLYALIQAAINSGVHSIRIHCFMDGRDVPPASGADYIQQLLDAVGAMVNNADTPVDVAIGSVEGRYYAMDRDNRWERVSQAYKAIVEGAPYQEASAVSAMEASYEAGVTDEFVVPMAFDSRGVQDGYAVIFFNFRPDRAGELTRSFVDADFSGFERKRVPSVFFVCLTEYDPEIDAPVAFPKSFPDHVLADVLADAGLTQYHIAETEKYAHVTFFLNGGREEPKSGEKRSLIPSPKVATYDLQPEMSEPAVASTLVDAINNDEADVYLVNFANCDMVGHTGDIPAAIAAVEAVDGGVGKVIDAIKAKGGVAFVTADHGNADQMLAEDGTPHTAHTTAPVPCIVIDEVENRIFTGESGKLADIAPTLLDAIGLETPQEMTGKSLLVPRQA